jgi:integrase
MLPERRGVVGKVLSESQKRLLFDTAASRQEWDRVYCAAVLAASTTCRGIELKHLQWKDVDLFQQLVAIRRSKTQTGQRSITLNSDARMAFVRLRQQAEAMGPIEPDHYVFPACERLHFDPTRPQTTWRTAWRSLVKTTARRAGRAAAEDALHATRSIRNAKQAYRKAARAFAGFRFHDLRHQAITELAEAGNPDAVIMGLAGHLSREMMEHYSHARQAAKKTATDALACGLMKMPEKNANPPSEAIQ